MESTSGETVGDALGRRGFLIGLGSLGVSVASGSVAASQAARAVDTPRAVKVPGATARTLAHAVRGPVFERGRPGFTAAARLYDPRFDHVQPRAVVQPLDAGDVRSALRFTIERDIDVRARSGGHSYAGYSTFSDGVVVDLRRLNGIEVDRRAGTATIGAGAQLIDVYAALARAGAVLPGGSCPSVGIAGVTLGGGFGLAARHLGLTADNLIGVHIVTADGRLQSVTHRSDPDLLWALKGGGGGNFGIVTQFTFRVHRLPASAAYFKVTWPWSSADEAIAAWQSWAPHATDRLTSILRVDGGGEPSVSAVGQYLGPASDLPRLLRSLLDVPDGDLDGHFDMAYLPLQLVFAGCAADGLAACHTVGASPHGRLARTAFRAKSDYVARPLPRAGRQAMIAAVEAPGSGGLLCDAYGGAINRVAADASAFVHRRELFCIQYYGDGDSAEWVDHAWHRMRHYVSGQAYQNYIDPALPDWEQAYYGRNLPRLKATRERVDPHHYFNFPQAVGR
jgi:FAD/FMN-containing dehydrogenase